MSIPRDLSDEQAVAVLRLVLERRGLTVDPFTADEQQAHLEEALAQPDVTDEVRPDVTASEGDVARTALAHLLDSGATTADDVERATALAADRTRDPLLVVGVGALVLLAFRGDIDLAHDPGKGWRFRFRTKGLSDSTVGKILGELLGSMLPKQ